MIRKWDRFGAFAADFFFSRQALTCLLTLTTGLATACSPQKPQTLITIADARLHAARFIDIGEPGDSVGDILAFDQPLLDEQGVKIGNNSGTCIRTRVEHSFQCQWTLTLDGGSIQVAGREFDQGESDISIVGGTGRYAGIRGPRQLAHSDDDQCARHGVAAHQQLQLLDPAVRILPADFVTVHGRRRAKLRLDILCAVVDDLRPAEH